MFTALSTIPGICVRSFAESIGPVRHLVLHPSGQLVAALNTPPGLVRMRVGVRGAHATDIVRFGPGTRGTGVTWRDGWLYFAADSGVIRYRWPADAEAPESQGEWIAQGLPVGEYGSAHTMKGIAVGSDGAVYVSIGSASDNCQQVDRQERSAGQYPCAELEWRAGIWKFTPPTASGGAWKGERYATGLRNAEAIAFDVTSAKLWAVTQGRDYLNREWGWSDSLAAVQPAEMLEQIVPGGNYGWPYCQGEWSRTETRLVPAPEYVDARVDCHSMIQPLLGFPAHWAPIALTVLNSTAPNVPHPGLMIAFHGGVTTPITGMQREGDPEGHYLMFVPLDSAGRVAGNGRILLHVSGDQQQLRASGVAVGLDGRIYVADDDYRRIWVLEPVP